MLAENDSPDIGFRFSLNPYRGCEHGCIYCYARPSHEYLGFSAGLDFERKIMVKPDAAALLRAALASPRWQPQVVALSGNTDCYQPVERRLRLTRACLEVFAEFRNPVSVITKSALVARDGDLLAELARHGAAHAFRARSPRSIPISRGAWSRAPRARSAACRPSRRWRAAGVPVGVMIGPVIPGLNDHEIPAILERAAAAGARSASWVMLRLASPLDQLFADWLEKHFPDRAARVLGRIRECRDGKLNDTPLPHSAARHSAPMPSRSAISSTSPRAAAVSTDRCRRSAPRRSAGRPSSGDQLELGLPRRRMQAARDADGGSCA